MIRPMILEDDATVRELFALCHPDRPAPPQSWYIANPTLVAVAEVVIGFTSFTVTVIPGFGRTMYGQDVCVHPAYQGKGIATQLHAARLNIARDVGCVNFIGATINDAMARVLIQAGAHRCISAGDTYMYVGTIDAK